MPLQAMQYYCCFPGPLGIHKDSESSKSNRSLYQSYKNVVKESKDRNLRGNVRVFRFLTLILLGVFLSTTLRLFPLPTDTQSTPIGIVAREGENVRLHCGANGVPEPRVTWRRLDNRTISMGTWEGM